MWMLGESALTCPGGTPSQSKNSTRCRRTLKVRSDPRCRKIRVRPFSRKLCRRRRRAMPDTAQSSRNMKIECRHHGCTTAKNQLYKHDARVQHTLSLQLVNYVLMTRSWRQDSRSSCFWVYSQCSTSWNSLFMVYSGLQHDSWIKNVHVSRKSKVYSYTTSTETTKTTILTAQLN